MSEFNRDGLNPEAQLMTPRIQLSGVAGAMAKAIKLKRKPEPSLRKLACCFRQLFALPSFQVERLDP